MNSCAATLTKAPENTTEMNVAASKKQEISNLTDIFTDFETDSDLCPVLLERKPLLNSLTHEIVAEHADRHEGQVRPCAS